MSESLLSVNGLHKRFDVGGGFFGWGKIGIDAVSGLSFNVARGETLAIVGESGCGKSTVGRCILSLVKPTDGKIYLEGHRIDNLSTSQIRDLRQSIQIVFQDPFSSLNPRQKVRDAIAEPLTNFGLASSKQELTAKVNELLQLVGLSRESADRWPHEFSGGQRQRIGIARALASKPKVIICDEAVSALDVSVKAQIINLLRDLQEKTDVALVFISHDLAIVENIAHRIAVMYLGKIVELGTTREIIFSPAHPYTRALLSAVPIADPTQRRARAVIEGEIPSPANPPSGCRFHTRCPYAFDRCRTEEPKLAERDTGQAVACHLTDLPDDRDAIAADEPR